MKDSIIFRPYLTTPVKPFLFYTCALTALLYCWNQKENWICLAIAVIPLLGVIGYGKPLLFLQHVVINKDKTVTIRYWFGEGYTEKIAKALYEILVKNDEIRSYRFNIQGQLFQVSPCVYKHGDDLASILEPFTKKKNISIKPTLLG